MKYRSRFSSALVLIAFACACAAQAVVGQNIVPDQSMADFCKKLPRPEYARFSQLEIRGVLTQDWFEVYDIAPGVKAIYEPFQWQEVISYLIEGEREALLFDTGNGIADIHKLAISLTEKPISVLNSHTHYDHVGGNHAFEKIYGMNTDFTRAKQRGVPNEQIRLEASPSALCRPLPTGVTQDNHVGRPFEVTDFIEDGAVIDLGGRILEVIRVTGHTPDAIVLVDRQAGLMWTGDTYYSGPIWLIESETDLDAYAKSIDRLVAEIPNLHALLPAHNTPWVEPEVLKRVQAGFTMMMKGSIERVSMGDGLVEYRMPGGDLFSFLLRDEPLPYSM